MIMLLTTRNNHSFSLKTGILPHFIALCILKQQMPFLFSKVGQKRWKVETFSRLDSVLLLSSVNLPGGELVRKMLNISPVQRLHFFPFKLAIRAFWNPWVLTDYANHLVENWTLLGEECATKYTQMQLKRLTKLHHLKHQPIFSKTLKWCKPLILMLQLNFLVEKHPLSPVAFRSTLFNSVIHRQYLLIWLCCTIVTGFCTLLLLLCKDYWLPIIFCLVG